MRNALVPMLASLAVCGAVTAVFIVNNAHAQSDTRKPMMVAQLDTPSAPEAGRPGMERRMPTPAEMAVRMKAMCQEHYARKAGALAYTEARLSLTASERPLFERWKQVNLDIARRRADDCGTRMAAMRDGKMAHDATMPTPVERMAREQDRLKKRLADLGAEQPALEALYNALSPEQKREFGHGGMHMMMQEHRFAGGPEMGHGMMMHGMMGRPMMDHMMHPPGPMMPPPPGSPADAPAAPPPQ